MGARDDIVDRLDAAISALKTEFSAVKDGIAEQVSSTHDTLGSLTWVLKRKDGASAALEQPTPVHDSPENGASSENEQFLQRQVEALRSEVALLRGQEAWLAAANQDLSERLAGARIESKECVAALAHAEEELEQLRKALADEAAAAGALRREVERLESERDHAPEISRHLAEEVASLRFDNACLQADIESMEARAAALERQQRVLIESHTSDGSVRRLGELLVAAGIITDEQLDEALGLQAMTPGQKLGAILMERAMAGEEEVAQAVACQCRLPLVRLSERHAREGCAALVDRKTCSHHQCVPLHWTDDRVFLAMADPHNEEAIVTVQQTSRRTVVPVVATLSDVTSAIRGAYGPH